LGLGSVLSWLEHLAWLVIQPDSGSSRRRRCIHQRKSHEEQSTGLGCGRWRKLRETQGLEEKRFEAVAEDVGFAKKKKRKRMAECRLSVYRVEESSQGGVPRSRVRERGH
jgi:hypothetical protein